MIKRIHCLWVGLAYLLITEGRSASLKERETEKEHDFDLGPLRCCARPRSSDVCPDISDYIPCNIANDMNARENNIKRTYEAYATINLTCATNVRNILCEQSFPTCIANSDGNHQVQLPRGTCEEDLSVCPSYLQTALLAEGFCSLANSTYTVGNCNASSPTQQLQLSYCTVNWYLPEWIHQYVKRIDVELGAAYTGQLGSSLSPACWEKYRQFRCRSVGRCWAQGDRLERINSRETCEEVSRCMPDDLQMLFAPSLACSSLPSEQLRPVTSPTDIMIVTSPTPPPVTSSTTSSPMPSPSPPVTDEPENSASRSLASPLIMVTVILSCLVMFS